MRRPVAPVAPVQGPSSTGAPEQRRSRSSRSRSAPASDTPDDSHELSPAEQALALEHLATLEQAFAHNSLADESLTHLCRQIPAAHAQALRAALELFDFDEARRTLAAVRDWLHAQDA